MMGGGCGEECEKEEECCWPVCSQVEVRNELLDLKTNREDLGVHKYWVLLAVVKE